MTTHIHTQISFNEANETLSHIVNIDVGSGFELSQLDIPNHTHLNWVDEASGLFLAKPIKALYQSIYQYMHEMYGDEHLLLTDMALIEGIKSIMLLVGDSAKKIEEIASQFNQKLDVHEFKEYKQLQSFYATKISKQVEQEVLGKWIFGLLKKSRLFPALNVQLESETSVDTEVNHIYVDLDSVKKDLDYELLFIRKQDGGRFFNPRLVRNLKLVYDFGGLTQRENKEGGQKSIAEWFDRMLQKGAIQIIKKIAPFTSQYYQTTKRYKNLDLVQSLNKALLALMMSSHENNLSRFSPVKNCMEYYFDFQYFLRQAMHTSSFQRWLAYPPQASNDAAVNIMELVHAICHAIFSQQNLIGEIHPFVQECIKKNYEGQPNNEIVSKQLETIYGGMSKWTRNILNGPLHKVLDMLEEGSCHTFDPVAQTNIPYKIYDLLLEENRIANLRIPSPTVQEFIDRASVIEEFKGFIRHLTSHGIPKKHLIINLQNRTTWLEHARCAVLEDLQEQEDFSKSLCVVTLANDTDFTNQDPPYSDINHAAAFLQVFREHLFGKQSGYYFPKNVSMDKLKDYSDKAMKAIHQIFFSGKNVLSVEERINFIDLFYLFLELKLIDLIKPSSFSLTCKDGLDLGMSMSAGLFALHRFIESGKLENEDVEFLHTLLYGPVFISRERLMISRHFHRFLNGVKTIENAIREWGNEKFKTLIQEFLSSAFDSPILQLHIILPQ